MNRIAIVTELLTAVPASYTAGQLAVIDTLGGIVKPTATGPYVDPVNVEVFVGTKEGPRQVGIINPREFSFSSKAHVTPVGRTVRVGYNGTDNNIVLVDPTIATNVTKSGALSIAFHDLTSNTTPSWGNLFTADIQIATGDTTAAILARLVAQATIQVAKINAKYGAGSVTFTSDVASANKYLQFATKAGLDIGVTLDGIFTGTGVKNTVVSITSGTTGAEIRELEKEAAILDGYNPTQVDKYQTFDLDNYLAADTSKNYDSVIVNTTSKKQYSSPGHPKGWDVEIQFFFANTTPGTLGAGATAFVAILTEMQKNHRGMSLVDATAAFAPHA